MEAADGYRRAAGALRDLDQEEQRWILEQLDPEDRHQIAALLRETGAPVNRPAYQTPNPSGSDGARAHGEGNEAAVLESAPADVLDAAFTGEPDWVIALMLTDDDSGPAIRRYVDQLPPGRSAHLRQRASALSASVTSNVRNVVRRGLVQRIERFERLRPSTPDFDSLVIQAVKK